MFPTVLPSRQLQRTCPVTPILQGIIPEAFSARQDPTGLKTPRQMPSQDLGI